MKPSLAGHARLPRAVMPLIGVLVPTVFLLAALFSVSTSASAAYVLIRLSGPVVPFGTNWQGPGPAPLSVDVSFIVDTKQFLSRQLEFGDSVIGPRLDRYSFGGVAVPSISIRTDGVELSDKPAGQTFFFVGDQIAKPSDLGGGYFAFMAGPVSMEYDWFPALTMSQVLINDDPLAIILLLGVPHSAEQDCRVAGAWGTLTFKPGNNKQAVLVPTVSIDIKPGSFPNSINLRSKGVVPVAILSSPGFNVVDVDVNTVRFADASPDKFTYEDVNSDGLFDLVLHFRTQDLQLTASSTQAMLIGKLRGGSPFIGTDSVRVVPSGGKEKD